MALGAQRGDIVRTVLGQGFFLAMLGSALGLVSAAATGRLVSTFLLGVAPYDPVTFAGAALVFTFVGLAACYAPARRATRIDPIEALRHD
jgi:ABC-type antimicrobial peptide transport system permease subunit